MSEDELDKVQKEFFNAIRSVNISLVEDLISRMQSPDKYQATYNIINRPDRDKDGGKQTSLFLAVILKDKEACFNITRLLLQHGGDVLHKDTYSQTPMYYLARDGKSDVMKLFIDSGANLNEVDDYNQTPIFYACREGHADTVRFMVEHGADVHHLDKHSENCLFYASREGRLEICRFLIERGVNVNQVDNMKQTAWYFAKKKGHTNIIELLEQAGATGNKNGRVTKKDAPKSSKGGQPSFENESKMAGSQTASALNKRKKEKEKARNPCRILFTDKQGNSRELTTEEWDQFKRDHPLVAGYIENPDTIPRDKLEDESQYEGWESVAGQILNNLWKMKGAQIFHKPVDAIKLGIPDYPQVIKEPMDFSTVKVGAFITRKN
jgi:ankyrin repeat protein